MIWRVEIYSYEIEDQVILCDVEAESEFSAIRKATEELRFQPFLKHHYEHHELINKVFIKDKDEDDQPWFLMARKVDEIEYPTKAKEAINIFQMGYSDMHQRIGCPPSLGRGMAASHIELGFTVASGAFQDLDQDLDQDLGTNGVNNFDFTLNRASCTSGSAGSTIHIVET